MSLRLTYLKTEIAAVRPYGWAPFLGNYNGTVFGHEFDFKMTYKLSSTFSFKPGKQWLNTPTLEWKEDIHWFEPEGGEGEGDDLDWKYRGHTPVDMFKHAPTSLTMSPFNWDATRDANKHPSWLPFDLDLRDRLKGEIGPAVWARMDERSKSFAFGEYYARHRKELFHGTTDRPGMQIKGGSGRGGGGLETLANGSTRRRVINFDIGLKHCDHHHRSTCTQILETQNGQPTISKFVIPALTFDQFCDRDYLYYLRTRINPANVRDQSFERESDVVVNRTLEWGADLKRRNLG